MKKCIVLVLISLTLFFPGLQASAQSGSVISLGEGSIIFPNSDVKLIVRGAENIYALVAYQAKSYLFFSQNEGRSWQKASSQGLPDQETYICLEAVAGQPDVLALATIFGVYLSRDAGNRFEYLGGPTNLAERGEQITSLDVVQGDPPQVLIGVWHPAKGKFPLEGVYLWGLSGKRSWTEQGLRASWQGRGYNADVTSVAFLGSAIMAVATGDPDRDGPLTEATYLNLGYPSEQASLRGGEWNWMQGWPAEISLQAGNSPKESEILNSKLAFPADLSPDDERDWKFFVAYNSLDKNKDGVYRVTVDDVADRLMIQKLQLPTYPALASLDSLAYYEGALAAGVTVKENAKDKILVYYLPKDGTSVDEGDWVKKRMEIADTSNCRVLLAGKDVLYVATSGKNSSFARARDDFLIPISLMDIPGNIRQVSLSPRFSTDRSAFLVYGESMLKVRLGSDSRLREAERIPLPQGLNLSLIRMEPRSSSLLFLVEPKAGRVWFTQNLGFSWSRREIQTSATDIRLKDDTIWVAGTDSKIYKSQDLGRTWQAGVSSGIRWLLRLEPGPQDEILAAGGTSEATLFNTISLVGEGFYNLPLAGKDFDAAFSPDDSSVYCTTGGRLYRFLLEKQAWEEMVNLRVTIAKITVSSRGIYLFANSQVYFSAFPLTVNSAWENLNPESRARWLGCQIAEISQTESLLFFWDSSRMIPYYHEVPEETQEEVIPEPVKTPEPVPAESPKTEPVNPEPVKQEPAKVEPETLESQPPAEQLLPPKAPQPVQKQGSAALLVVVIILSLTVVFLLFIVFRMWRIYRYYV